MPYVHLLFDRDELDRFADATGRPRLTVSCNEKPVAYFRQMLGDFHGRFRPVSCLEKFNISFADAVARHPGCFRRHVSDFDELIVRSFELTLRKQPLLSF